MTVKELEEYLKNVKDKSQSVYFYHCDDNPFDDGIGVENAFEVLRDQKNTGVFEGGLPEGKLEEGYIWKD